MNHPSHDIFESRKQFQLERMILFSDAVFAIAITLLIIEIKVPHFDTAVTEQQLEKALLDKWPEFFGFVLSFAVIGQFWTSHHRLFGYLKSYDRGLLWLNLLMLMFVVLMPFSTFLNMGYGNLDITWCWYSMNLALIELCIYMLWRYIGKKQHLNTMAHDKHFMKHMYTRSFIVMFIFMAGGLLTLLPWLQLKWCSRFLFFLIFPALALTKRRFNKVHKKRMPAHEAGIV